MLNLMLKKDEILKIGDNISIKLQSYSSAQIAIDAPKEINIKRVRADGSDVLTKKKEINVNNNR